MRARADRPCPSRSKSRAAARRAPGGTRISCATRSKAGAVRPRPRPGQRVGSLDHELLGPVAVEIGRADAAQLRSGRDRRRDRNRSEARPVPERELTRSAGCARRSSRRRVERGVAEHDPRRRQSRGAAATTDASAERARRERGTRRAAQQPLAVDGEARARAAPGRDRRRGEAGPSGTRRSLSSTRPPDRDRDLVARLPPESRSSW